MLDECKGGAFKLQNTHKKGVIQPVEALQRQHGCHTSPQIVSYTECQDIVIKDAIEVAAWSVFAAEALFFLPAIGIGTFMLIV